MSTACFDVEKRLLILPIWKTASNTVYDLLVGHEVGHALYTPNESFGDAPRSFVNVLEDARIERMMKVTYPGLRRSFFDGYKELWDQDFFGVKNDDPAELSFIDRINLYFKGNPNLPFSDVELEWVERVANTKTFAEVKQLAKELYDYCAEQQEQKESEPMPAMPSPDGTETPDEQEEVDPVTDEKESETESGDDGESEQQSESDADEAQLDVPSYQGGGETDETECVTDEALAQALETLIDDNAKEWVYLTVPTPDIDNIIVPHKEVQTDLHQFFYECEIMMIQTKSIGRRTFSMESHTTRVSRKTLRRPSTICVSSLK